MHSSIGWKALKAAAAASACAALTLTACGRGPVEPFPGPVPGLITITMFISGTVDPTQGNYMIVVSTNLNATTNLNTGEAPTEPNWIYASGNPASWTGWDQAMVYGSNPDPLLPNCPLPSLSGFTYCYKSINLIGGTEHIEFVPIAINPNSYIFNPSATGNATSQSAIAMTMPLDCFDIGDGQAGSGACGLGPNFGFPESVQVLYVNLLTTDTNGNLQDQLACQQAASFIVNIYATTTTTQQLVKPQPCTLPTPPSNSSLLITGGQITVTPATPAPATSPTPPPSPSPSPSSSP